MEISANKVTVVCNGIENENSICFECDDKYFKIARQNKNLQFIINGKILEIPIKKLSTSKNKRWIKFESKSGRIYAYFFLKDTEREIAKKIIFEITGENDYNNPIIFSWIFNMDDNRKFDNVLNALYDNI
jgi:hypothetical protein